MRVPGPLRGCLLEGRRPRRIGGHRDPIGGVDHAPRLIEEQRLGIGRQIIAQRRDDEVGLIERDDPHDRTDEIAPAPHGLDDVQRPSHPRILGQTKLDPGASSPQFLKPGLIDEAAIAELGPIGNRSDAIALRRNEQDRRVVEHRMVVRALEELLFGE